MQTPANPNIVFVSGQADFLNNDNRRFWPVTSAPSGVPAALQAHGLHQRSADPIGAAEEDDKPALVGSTQDLQHLVARGGCGKHLHQVGGPLAVLGVVVRASEVERLLPDLAHMLAAISRQHDGRDEALAARECVADEVVFSPARPGDGADDLHEGLPTILLSEACEPVAGVRGETACLDLAQALHRDWRPWYGHATVLRLTKQEQLAAGAPAATPELPHPTRAAPLCQHCRHCLPDNFDRSPQRAWCIHPAAAVNPVDGSPADRAVHMREANPKHALQLGVTVCGPAGNLFAPRECVNHRA